MKITENGAPLSFVASGLKLNRGLTMQAQKINFNSHATAQNPVPGEKQSRILEYAFTIRNIMLPGVHGSCQPNRQEGQRIHTLEDISPDVTKEEQVHGGSQKAGLRVLPRSIPSWLTRFSSLWKSDLVP